MSEPRLIDASELHECLSATCNTGYETYPEEYIHEMIDEIDTIDPETLPIVQMLRERVNALEELLLQIKAGYDAGRFVEVVHSHCLIGRLKKIPHTTL